MLFKSCLFILLWAGSAYAVTIENLVTTEVFTMSPEGNYSIFNFVSDQIFDIQCKAENESVGTLRWALQSPETNVTKNCETTEDDSIWYRVILSPIDDKRQISCLFNSFDGVIEKATIILNYTGGRLENEEYGDCFLPTEFACTNSLNRLHMNISVNGKILVPNSEMYLPAHEFDYYYSGSENIDISCLAYNNAANHIAMCLEKHIPPKQRACVGNKPCELRANIKLNDKNKTRIVHCYTSNLNEPLASLKLIPLSPDSVTLPDTVTLNLDEVTETTTEKKVTFYETTTELKTSPETTTPKVVTEHKTTPETTTPKVVTETTTKGKDIPDDVMDDINKPIFNLTLKEFYILLSCLSIFVALTIILATYTICKRD